MSRRAESGGFVLIGVIMFVLALTIVGMSLFAVSGYEASFLGQSRDENSALYGAQGGIDMVVQLLQVQPARLEKAHQAEGSNIIGPNVSIDSAYATQPLPGGGIATSGVLSDSVVTITVVGSAFGIKRKLVAKYLPGNNESYYKRLFTVAGNVTLPPHEGYDDLLNWSRYRTFRVADSSPDPGAWANDPDPSWADSLAWLGHPPPRVGGVPAPEVTAFMAAHPTGPVPPFIFSSLTAMPGTVTLDQHPPTGVPFFYRSLAAASYSVEQTRTGVNAPPDLYVWITPGTAIWMLPSGLASRGPLRVRLLGSGSATLVIVASPASPPRSTAAEINYGILIAGGLDADPRVNVILVSDGTIHLEHYENFATTSLTQCSALHLSMFCSALDLIGPVVPLSPITTLSYLGYDASTMDSAIDALEAAGALPGAHGGTASGFSFVERSWRDLTP